MIVKNLHLALLFFLLLGPAACATFDVKTEHDPTADFAGLKTFAFPKREDVEESGVQNNSVVRERIEGAVSRELTAKGLRPAGSGRQPDLMVYYWVSVQDKQRKAWRAGYGWGARYGGGGTTYPYEEGSLIVDLVEPAKGELAWRATIAAHLENTTDENLDLASRGIAKAFESYPPKNRTP
ncbi:MAG: DUF4136 domain-containing protein [Nitrospira sp. CR1.3]|nr:DUF4136 domain-containing protein [Nitrospira sp. CR1.3]